MNLYKNLKKSEVWGLLLKLKRAGPAVCTSKWIKMNFWNFLQRDSVVIPSGQAQRWAVTSLSFLAPSDPLGSSGSLHVAESPPTVLKWNALWIWGSRKSSQALLVHTPCQPRTDVSGVNLGVLLFVLESADPFCLVGFGDFILLVTLSKSSCFFRCTKRFPCDGNHISV